MTVSLGLLLAVIYFIQLLIAVVILIHKRVISRVRHIKGVTALEEFLKRMFTASNVRGTIRLKRAGTRKINIVLHNALSLHRRAELHAENDVIQIDDDLTFGNFLLYGERTTLTGSFTWSWRQILSGRLFDTVSICACFWSSLSLRRQLITHALLFTRREFGCLAASSSSRWHKLALPS